MDPELYQPPFDTKLEQYVLSAMFYDPDCIADVIEVMKPKYFYHREHEKLYDRIVTEWSEDPKKVDLKLFAPLLVELNISFGAILESVKAIFTVANIKYHCDQLRDLAMIRASHKIGERLMKDCASAAQTRDKESIQGAIGKAELDLARLNEATVRTDSTVSMKDAVMKFHERFEAMYYNTDGGVSGLQTDITDLDAITAGLQKSDLIIIGARPSMGKTTFASQIALNVSLRGVPTAMFSLEQSSEQIARRAMANQALIDLSKLNAGLIDDQEWEKYTNAMDALSRANLVIDDEAALTVNEIKAKCRKIRRERGLELILIDYLGKLGPPDPRMNRYEAVSENARMLKNMAKEFDVPVICLAQLSRGVEQRQDKRPMMSDLRESGEIEQEADIIGFLYRDDYYNHESQKKNITELILAKNRNGKIGSVEMVFLKQYNRFVNLDRGHAANAEQMALV
ncbi:replicative DNA helicase [Cohnella sp. JJ-181]|uniref:replicative DNA helicase n=1 Tax=Cohnella rhizoplanae TaxID=2974897 RepID=UPI0022FFA15B|nr:replicative DNA helicase [Cohnella sp. JJ-181]CAI6072925.1 Replicative DNA helicase [Cohnella sp. JJ-181]